MGYYTDYKLTCSEPELLDKIIEDDENDLGWLYKNKDGSYSGNSKWYGHELDIAELSKKHHDVIFTLDGDGEEPGDLWRKYFRNGLVQHCAVVTQYEAMNFLKFEAPKEL